MIFRQPSIGTFEIVVAVLCILSSVFLTKLYRVRRYVRRLGRVGLPMPPCHHLLWGHLPLVIAIVRSLPKAAHGVYLGDQIRQRYPELKSAFYLDIWPFGPIMLIVLDPDMMYQLTQANQIPKDKGIRKFLRPLTGEKDLVTLEGPEWKHWRSRFNPGFSSAHILTLVPGMVEETIIFKNILSKHAESGDILHLEEASLNLTIDIIGRAVMDHSFHSQTRYNEMTASLRNQLLWCTTGLNANPLEYFNIFRPFVHLFNSWKMNRYLVKELDTRYTSLQANGSDKNNLGKSVIDLALAAYVDETPSATGINTTFKDFAISQIKLFVFAGHDTTSAAAVFTYHLLSQNPAVLAKVREEHDHIFGDGSSSVGDVISSNPALLNRLVFTLAVIKESLRIYPTVAALRDGQFGFFLQDENGRKFPTENCLVWGDHYAVHHNPYVWPRPEDFLPERWMVSEGHPLYPPKNAWRPFEKGPRNCIGQELALTEVKVMLAMTIREFKITDAYTAFDLIKGNPIGANVNGQRAYMMLRGGGHPADHYPCKVAYT